MGLRSKMRAFLGGSSTRLLEAGTPTTATVLEVGETGVFRGAGQSPVFELKLLVQSASSEPYEVVHRELVRHLAIPRFQPGLTVPLRVDPADPNTVTIDWAADWPTEAASRSTDPLAQLSALSLEQAREVELDQERSAAPALTEHAEATVLGIDDQGAVGQLSRLKLQLKVEPTSGRDSFEVAWTTVCSDRIRAMIVPGARFAARFDPHDVSSVDVDFPPP